MCITQIHITFSNSYFAEVRDRPTEFIYHHTYFIVFLPGFTKMAAENVVGFDLDDLLSVDPFKDTYSIVTFVIFAQFIITIIALIAIAFLFSVCQCCCPCTTGMSDNFL